MKQARMLSPCVAGAAGALAVALLGTTLSRAADIIVGWALGSDLGLCA